MFYLPIKLNYYSTGRRGLIIANLYIGEKSELRCCKTDALEMKQKLEECKFKVSFHIDLDITEMRDKFDEFTRTLEDNDIVIFFFSGHGVSYQGHQFLIPCKMIEPENDYQIKYRAFGCQAAIYKLASRVCSGLKIIITDACRTEYENVLKGMGSKIGAACSIKFVPNGVESDASELEGDVIKNVSNDLELRNIVRMCASIDGQAAEAPRGSALSYYTRSMLKNILTPNQSIMKLNISISEELKERDAKPEISIVGAGTLVETFRFNENN